MKLKKFLNLKHQRNNNITDPLFYDTLFKFVKLVKWIYACHMFPIFDLLSHSE